MHACMHHSRPLAALHLLLQASQMHFRNGQAQGFALFVTGALARAAVDAIQNLLFDNEAVLRAEMAHKNMWVLAAGCWCWCRGGRWLPANSGWRCGQLRYCSLLLCQVMWACVRVLCC